MGTTPYNLINRAYSDKAHACARREIYPAFFKKAGSALRYTEPTITQDAAHGIDRIVRVTVQGLNAPLTFLVQERFRRPNIALYNDITMSEWLGNSNKPSELYTIRAQLFLWGRYDEEQDTMVESLFFWVQPVLHGLATGDIPFKRLLNERQGKYFVAIPIAALKARNLIAYHNRRAPIANIKAG